MHKPNKLFEILSKNTTRNNNSWRHKGLYRQLYNLDLFALSYQKIYSNYGSLTRGTDNKSIDSFSISRVEDIISSLKSEKYKPSPVKRIYIPKRNGKLRPLGIPTFDDRLIQESVRAILESIYEPIFSKDSHGFRPKRSCHTALLDIKRKSIGKSWWIEGDIKSFFDDINHNILIEILRKKIQDERFLRLIRKFLKSGYMEDWNYNKTLSGTPQGGIISPILANIYLNEFDQWINSKIADFNKGNKRSNPQYKRLTSSRDYKIVMIKRRMSLLKESRFSDKEKAKFLLEIETIKKEISSINKKIRSSGILSINPMDNSFRRMVYTRYADDWTIGIIGSKEDASKLKNQINEYLKKSLELNLSEEKTLITNGNDGFNFLGYFIKKRKMNTYVKLTKAGYKQRTMNAQYQLLMPKRKEFDYIIQNRFGKYKNGKLVASAQKKLFANDNLEIMLYFNTSFRGLYNYYKIADNVCNLNTARWIWKLSWGKTMANKYRSTKKKQFNKYRIGKRIGIGYDTKKGQRTTFLFDEPLRKSQAPIKYNVDDKSNDIYQIIFTRTSLMDRLKARKCELCDATDRSLNMHHVKRIKELKKKKHLSPVEKFMITRNRKQIALCEKCHNFVHANDRC